MNFLKNYLITFCKILGVTFNPLSFQGFFVVNFQRNIFFFFFFFLLCAMAHWFLIVETSGLLRF